MMAFLSKWPIRLITILGTIIAAMFIAGLRVPIALVAPLYWFIFPGGLYYLIHQRYGYGSSELIRGWLFYACIVVIGTLFRNRFFFLIYGILVIVLILNIKGCSEMPIGSQ